MKIALISYYPHFMGTTSGTVQVDATLFCMMLTLAVDYDLVAERDELWDMMEFGLLKNRKCNRIDRELHAKLLQEEGCGWHGVPEAFEGFYNGISPQRSVKKMMKSFEEKGFIAGEWEEGTFAVALPGYEQKAKKAMAKIESGFIEDDIMGDF